LFNRSIQICDKLLRRYTPDPFLFAILLTFILFFAALYMTPSSASDIVLYWGDGFWGLIPFTLQMVMVLVGGYVTAVAPPIQKALIHLSKIVKTPGQAVILVTLSATLGCLLNWGLGLIVGGMMCRHVIKQVPTANFRLLVASAYSGFLVWHGGFSGSIPLTLATPDNFSEKLVGGLIPVQETLLSPLNICAVLGLFILLPLTNFWLSRQEDINPVVVPNFEGEDSKTETPDPHHALSPAEKIEKSRLVSYAIAGLGGAYLLIQALSGKLSLNLNSLNFIFIFSAIFLHKTPESFIKAITEAAKKVGPILLQFPFYAGIMGMMVSSNLAVLISEAFVNISTVKTFPLLTFYSAGLVNIFVPSGGGQWAIQAPVVLAAAKEIGANIPLASMAVAWGDAWTNMLQPFWALPLLAVSGLHLRDIIGYCLVVLITSGTLLSILFMVIV
jgi:short-chain fatty acids transporter